MKTAENAPKKIIELMSFGIDLTAPLLLSCVLLHFFTSFQHATLLFFFSSCLILRWFLQKTEKHASFLFSVTLVTLLE